MLAFAGKCSATITLQLLDMLLMNMSPACVGLVPCLLHIVKKHCYTGTDVDTT